MVGSQAFFLVGFIGVLALLFWIPPACLDALAQPCIELRSRLSAQRIDSGSVMASAPESLLENHYEEASVNVGPHASATQASSTELGEPLLDNRCEEALINVASNSSVAQPSSTEQGSATSGPTTIAANTGNSN